MCFKRASRARRLRALRSLLGVNGGLLTHGGENNDVDVLLLLSEQLLDLVTNVTLWDLDVVLLVTRVGEEVQETVVGNVDELVLLAADVRDVHVVGGRGQILQLL